MYVLQHKLHIVCSLLLSETKALPSIRTQCSAQHEILWLYCFQSILGNVYVCIIYTATSTHAQLYTGKATQSAEASSAHTGLFCAYKTVLLLQNSLCTHFSFLSYSSLASVLTAAIHMHAGDSAVSCEHGTVVMLFLSLFLSSAKVTSSWNTLGSQASFHTTVTNPICT
jgi:hypothetical protein